MYTVKDNDHHTISPDVLFYNPKSVPFSFIYGNIKYRGIPETFRTQTIRKITDANIYESCATAQDNETGLQITVEYFKYKDYPVCEWTIYFKNTGLTDTPILENIKGIDAAFDAYGLRLWHCNGDYWSRDGYTPTISPVEKGTRLSFTPVGGRPCDHAFPYFRMLYPDGGLNLAVGWPGQWSVDFIEENGNVLFTAGQEITHLVLKPGEKVRTPRITLMRFEGSETDGINMWRKWYRTHIMPRQAGKKLSPKLVCTHSGDGEEFTAANEKNQLAAIQDFIKNGIKPNLWWIDAGWYPCVDEDGYPHWTKTGSWFADPERFPEGIAPVGKALKKNDVDFLLWFEPERVRPGTWIYENHPDWLLCVFGETGHASGQNEDELEILKSQGVSNPNINYLLNLGIDECRDWLTEHVDRLIKEYGITCYRQDFNFEPLRYWRENEPENRKGVSENLHIQGYLQYWDNLLFRNPGLFIDSCASGGRRNDLETMRRSVPLHHTDWGYGDHSVKTAFHHTLAQWIPYFRSMVLDWGKQDGTYYDVPPKGFINKVNEFSFHCALAPMLALSGYDPKDVEKNGLVNKMVSVWREVADYIIDGDYYPLTPYDPTPKNWFCWQFNIKETGEGFVQALRHTLAEDERLTVKPGGLCRNCDYRFENPETGLSFIKSGEEMEEKGITFQLAPRTGMILIYKKMVIKK